MSNSSFRDFRPVLFLFTFVTVFCISGRSWLEKQGIDSAVVIVGNVLLFAVSLAASLLNTRSLQSSNPQSSVRAMYGGFMIRFFVLAIAAFIYIMMEKKQVNKAGLMICAGLYVLYSGFETRALLRMSKQNRDA